MPKGRSKVYRRKRMTKEKWNTCKRGTLRRVKTNGKTVCTCTTQRGKKKTLGCSQKNLYTCVRGTRWMGRDGKCRCVTRGGFSRYTVGCGYSRSGYKRRTRPLK